jgi:hypothetical protein
MSAMLQREAEGYFFLICIIAVWLYTLVVLRSIVGTLVLFLGMCIVLGLNGKMEWVRR